MTHNNLSVQPNADWRIYTATTPAGSRALGTVSRDGSFSQAGALVITAAGIYAQINAGVLRSLPQKQVASALAMAAHD